MNELAPAPDIPPSADSGLRCPKCEYNLTGVAENRCPECGEMFDPEQLRAILAGAPAPIPVWDDKGQSILLRFIHVCLLTWFAPVRVGRTFPDRYSSRSARDFRRIVLGVMLVLGVLATVSASAAGPGARDLLFSGLVYLPGMFVCELMLTMVFNGWLAPDPADGAASSPPASRSFRGMVGLFRSYALLEVAIASAGSFCGLHGYRSIAHLTRICLFLVAVWWWAALTLATATKLGSFRESFSVAMTILFVTAVSLVTLGVIGVAIALVASAIASAFV